MTAPKNDETIYINTGDPTTFQPLTLYRPGELGHRVFKDSKWYQLVQVDSGPAAVTAGDVLFWKDDASYVVTNKLADAPRGQNGIAGVSPITLDSATISGEGFLLCANGGQVSTKANGSFAAGDIGVANSGTDSDAVAISAGTAPTYIPLGSAVQADSGGFVLLDLSIGDQAPNP